MKRAITIHPDGTTTRRYEWYEGGKDRRAACLLCGGRCDPDRWVCSNCHPRLLRLAVESTLEEARRDGAMAEPVVGGEDSGAGAQRQSAKTEDRY